ncbi:uncharacterized protein LOC131875451 [Cryptomeria japonica]|uniref:uncharacterized protein LOC131875451 n=1 Tax=Cryptomeria japonica TaxID=3369 RepID=UPI0027DA0C08|nr:uncharacterized protein LOC131875451 [Cryptomeria japonica]
MKAIVLRTSGLWEKPLFHPRVLLNCSSDMSKSEKKSWDKLEKLEAVHALISQHISAASPISRFSILSYLSALSEFLVDSAWVGYGNPSGLYHGLFPQDFQHLLQTIPAKLI